MARKRNPRHNLTIIMEAKEEEGIMIGLQANLINFEEAKGCMAQMET